MKLSRIKTWQLVLGIVIAIVLHTAYSNFYYAPRGDSLLSIPIYVLIFFEGLALLYVLTRLDFLVVPDIRGRVAAYSFITAAILILFSIFLTVSHEALNLSSKIISTILTIWGIIFIIIPWLKKDKLWMRAGLIVFLAHFIFALILLIFFLYSIAMLPGNPSPQDELIPSLWLCCMPLALIIGKAAGAFASPFGIVMLTLLNYLTSFIVGAIAGNGISLARKKK